MKKFIAAVLCISIFIGVFSLGAFACEKSKNIDLIQKLNYSFGSLISIFADGINRLTGVDEKNITKAEEMDASWEIADSDFIIESPDITLECETWVMNEITLTSEKSYSDPFNDVDVDLVLIGNGRKYTVPGFWNGGSEWKVRFVCPKAGNWYFYTVCTDTDNEKLHNVTGTAVCSEYSGTYDIYKNGFVTTRYGEKYFTYDDSTPFLYLGDTHWSLGDETTSMVETISKKRAEQGFTVIQSEPIGAGFDLTNGVSDDDMAGFEDYDCKFLSIASNGLVHANAQFFFPSYIDSLIANNGGYADTYTTKRIDGKSVKFHDLSEKTEKYLEKLSRYWVARYSAFPVLWTLGQEVDNDFYYAQDNHGNWSYVNNPYKLIAEYIDKYDCYDHPITAHQENAGATVAYGNGEGTDEKCRVYKDNAVASAFRDVNAHTWYAVQWSPSKTEQSDYSIEKDYWYNSQGKPAINYEGQYCYLWTKNFGSRMQGWCSYLNGMYGYGWGGHDTWSYLNTYDEENDSSDGVDTITSQEKKDATWLDSLEYISSYQCGYMLDFLKNTQWYNLVPRFDNRAYFVPCTGVKYVYAGNADNSEIVIYFYSFSDENVAENANSDETGAVLTGTVGKLLKNTEYKYKWFNPQTGEYSQEYSFKSSVLGTYAVGEKQNTDMVLYIYLAK